MADVLVSALAGVVFGLALAAPPGAMNAIIAEESVLRGWLAGFRAGLGAATADFTFFLLALAGLVTVVQNMPLVRTFLFACGGVLMLYFAYGAFRDARSAASFVETSDADEQKGFQKAFVLALTNPYQIAFWLTLGVGLVEPGTLDVLGNTPYVGESLAGLLVVQKGSPALVVGFFGGIALWITGFPATLVAVGRRVDRFAPAVAYASAVVLAAFGILFLSDAASSLL